MLVKCMCVFYLIPRAGQRNDSDVDWEPPLKKSSRKSPAAEKRAPSPSVSTCPSPPSPVPSAAPGFSTPRGVKRGRGRGTAKAGGRTRSTVTSPPPNPNIQRWKTAAETDTAPVLLQFRPARLPGPQSATRRAVTPMDFFKLFFTDLVLATLLDNMNAISWTVLKTADLYSFLAMVIYMGVYKLPELVDYWKQNRLLNLPFPPSAMSRNKFLLMLKYLRLCPLDEDARNQAARGTPNYDRLGKIKPLYQQIVQACKEHFHPDQNISIDERMVKSKARSSLKQYIKNKPTKWGYKLFVLADSQSGYTWNFLVYEGKASNTGKGLSYDSVMSLIDIEKMGTGYHLDVDNFYTSPHLFKDLLGLKVGACGTIRSMRVGFPRTTENDFYKE